MAYCESLTNYVRRISVEVPIGHLPMGGLHPIRVQTMTDTRTSDIKATVDQCMRLAELKADYIRITCPSIKDVQYLEAIKKEMLEASYNTPIIADIHFSPQAAYEAARVVDKIRINPGNYTDKKAFEQLEFTTETYLEEIEKLNTVFVPLLQQCIEHETPIRIGVNHGSLSDRIMSKYGDTPEGMAESAMEFLRIAKKENFNHIVISMKASNTIIMVQASRMLVHKMLKEDMHYPLHLGVTEAGDGEDGRIKSAVGIGTLLADGIGETIRVSLTENPEKEIPVAQKLVAHFKEKEGHSPIPPIEKYFVNPYTFKKRKTHEVLTFGNYMVPKVIAGIPENTVPSGEMLNEIGWHYNANTNAWNFAELAADFMYCDLLPENMTLPTQKGIILNVDNYTDNHEKQKNIFPLVDLARFQGLKTEKPIFLELTLNDFIENAQSIDTTLTHNTNVVLVFTSVHKHATGELRFMFNRLFEQGHTHPVIIYRAFRDSDLEMFQVRASCDTGSMFIDGLGDGLWITNSANNQNGLILSTAFGILQACRARTYKTEYISCPGCGRTLFELQKTTQSIKEQTAHLKGLKIGVMGCIVNGPGEMADADYGYVGSGPGKISLYKNRELVRRNIPEDRAVDELIDLIKENGDWKERSN